MLLPANSRFRVIRPMDSAFAEVIGANMVEMEEITEEEWQEVRRGHSSRLEDGVVNGMWEGREWAGVWARLRPGWHGMGWIDGNSMKTTGAFNPPPNRRPTFADFVDLFCRLVAFLDFAGLFCRVVWVSGAPDKKKRQDGLRCGPFNLGLSISCFFMVIVRIDTMKCFWGGLSIFAFFF